MHFVQKMQRTGQNAKNAASVEPQGLSLDAGSVDKHESGLCCGTKGEKWRRGPGWIERIWMSIGSQLHDEGRDLDY